MSVLVEVADFRSWAGAAASTVPDELIQGVLDESEAGLLADLGVGLELVQAEPDAIPLASGEVLRRSSRLLARRNSPEAISGFGDVAIAIPVRDPDSYRTIRALYSILLLQEGIA